MSYSLEYSLVRIFNNDNQPLGVGFVIDGQHIITCWHVISKATTDESLQILVDFPYLKPGELLFAKVVDKDVDVDLARIRLVGPMPSGCLPAPISQLRNLWGHKCKMFGIKDGESVWVDGVLKAQNPNGLVQIEINRRTGYDVQRGFSGSPVWDIDNSAVVGIIASFDTNKMARTSYMIPSTKLISTLLGSEHLQNYIAHNHNLPSRKRFIDRVDEKEIIFRWLNSSRETVLTIEGLGGMGKTVLAVEVAYDCIEGNSKLDDPLSHIVYFSAKSPIQLNTILEAIAQALGANYIAKLELNEKIEEIYQKLKNNRVLIIANDFETIDDANVIEFVNDLPEPTKAIITTRKKKSNLKTRNSIPLRGLSYSDALELIRNDATGLGLDYIQSASDRELDPLINTTDGNPLALETSLGSMSRGVALDRVVRELSDVKGQAEDKIFNEIYPLLWGTLDESAKKVLLALTFFSDTANRAAIKFICDFDDETVNNAISQLIQAYLVHRHDPLFEYKQRFSLHRLTLSFVKTRISDYQEWARNARARWAEWHIDFAIEHRGTDWWEQYLEDHKLLDREWNNIRAVFDWGKSDVFLFERIKSFWLNEDLSEFVKSYGYWDDREEWLLLIHEKAKQEGNTQEYVMSASGLIWIWARLGNPDKLNDAEELGNSAWEFRNRVSNSTASKLADNIAVLKSHKEKWDEAWQFFNIAMELLEKSELNNEVLSRRKCHILYYQARQMQKEGNLLDAEKLYRVGLHHATIGRWNRGVIFFKNRLAEIALENGDFNETENILRSVLSSKGINSHKRALAYYHRTYAKLYKKKNTNREKCQENAKLAYTYFDQLGMKPQVEEMEKLLPEC